MPLKQIIYYQAHGKNSKDSGEIAQSIKDAAQNFFDKYPTQDVCWVSKGDAVGKIFIADFHSTPAEIERVT